MKYPRSQGIHALSQLGNYTFGMSKARIVTSRSAAVRRLALTILVLTASGVTTASAASTTLTDSHQVASHTTLGLVEFGLE